MPTETVLRLCHPCCRPALLKPDSKGAACRLEEMVCLP
jgi:hypothetical protein